MAYTRVISSLTALVILLASVVIVSTATPVSAVTADPGDNCATTFFTFPNWHAGLRKDANCRVLITNINQLWVIGFNILNIAIQIAAYAAAAIIFTKIFAMVTARGDPGKISSAALGIRNAIIGLIIALISIAIVNFITTSIAAAT